MGLITKSIDRERFLEWVKEKAFVNIKVDFSEAVMSCFPTQNKPFDINTDASLITMTGIVSQNDSKK